MERSPFPTDKSFLKIPLKVDDETQRFFQKCTNDRPFSRLIDVMPLLAWIVGTGRIYAAHHFSINSSIIHRIEEG